VPDEVIVVVIVPDLVVTTRPVTVDVGWRLGFGWVIPWHLGVLAVLRGGLV
jgi:hypothetical protein